MATQVIDKPTHGDLLWEQPIPEGWCRSARMLIRTTLPKSLVQVWLIDHSLMYSMWGRTMFYALDYSACKTLQEVCELAVFLVATQMEDKS